MMHSGTNSWKLLTKLQQIALPDIQIEPQLLSNARAWEMLRQPGHYCALNKVHTPERATFLYFAKLPTSVYPPLQLLSTQPLSDHPIDLEALLKQQPELKIGVVSGRSYNARIDALIKQYPQQFYQRSGDDAAEIQEGGDSGEGRQIGEGHEDAGSKQE